MVKRNHFNYLILLFFDDITDIHVKFVWANIRLLGYLKVKFIVT